MRRDVMTWIGRLVGGVFALGVLALLGAVVVMIRQAEGVPPWPLFMGIVGLVLLILLAGACLALISIAVSARRGAAALQALRAGAGSERAIAAPVEAGRSPASEPASEPAARDAAMAPPAAKATEPMQQPSAPPQPSARGPLSPSGLSEATGPRATRPARVLVARR